MDMDKPWTGTNLTRFEEMRAAGMPKQLSRLASGRRLMDSRGTGFYGEKKYRMPGYTGYIPALHETVAKTPTHAQDKTFHPEDHTFLRERKKPPVINPERDSCNDKSVYSKGHVKGETVNLWPDLQDSVWPETEDLRPESAKPQAVHIVHGDRRIRGKRTQTAMDYKPPSRPNSARAVDPVTLNTLQSREPQRLKAMYEQSTRRVGVNMLQMMLMSMRKRLEAKVEVGSNANAHKMRRLFKMYDEHQDGKIELPDFRIMLESFGIQLSEDQLITVFALYDKQFSGEIFYCDLMKDLLDEDLYKFYVSGVNL